MMGGEICRDKSDFAGQTAGLTGRYLYRKF